MYCELQIDSGTAEGGFRMLIAVFEVEQTKIDATKQVLKDASFLD